MEFLDPYMNYIITAGVVIIAIIALVLILRAFGGRTRGRKGKRLGVSEYREIDKTRRLILVRRDDVEHLIMVGGGQSLVIEQGIGEELTDEYASPAINHNLQAPAMAPEMAPAPISEREPEYQEDYEPEPTHRPAPRAPVFGGDRAPNIRPVHRGEPRLSTPLNAPDDGY